MTKIESAFEMFKANPTVSRKDFIALLMTKLNMSAAAASTYHANVKAKFNKENAVAVASEVTIAVTKPVEPKKIVVDTTEIEQIIEEANNAFIPSFVSKSLNEIIKNVK